MSSEVWAERVVWELVEDMVGTAGTRLGSGTRRRVFGNIHTQVKDGKSLTPSSFRFRKANLLVFTSQNYNLHEALFFSIFPFC